ncbi:RNA polymerase sigma factor [Sinomicrobium soli]|uniref:RNA polymerase sigma factor n=1 Tax=Sinomicrobium sp. N-1-3-6 TaxID=2219864 RepID=UPI000DCAEFF8|nr:RNA polymerase sigma-70 factor [Sinomicrobium sp. N-1-3-6]RAV30459.1 RNA polymerase sigma-70 factor [Sinomicrobium sp. N-1-3-6]
MSKDPSAIRIQVEQIKSSDRRAFQRLFEQLWPPMYTYAFSLLEDEALAKDMVQEVWIDFWERRQNIENTNIKAYLYKAVRFRTLRELRDSKIKASLLEAVETINAGDAPEEETPTPEEISILLENELSVLPKKCREVFKLSKLRGLKNKEIAKELGISENTVENHMTKAFELLKMSRAFFLSLPLALIVQYFTK